MAGRSASWARRRIRRDCAGKGPAGRRLGDAYAMPACRGGCQTRFRRDRSARRDDFCEPAPCAGCSHGAKHCSANAELIAIALGYVLLWLKLNSDSQVSTLRVLQTSGLGLGAWGFCHRYQEATERYGRRLTDLQQRPHRAFCERVGFLTRWRCRVANRRTSGRWSRNIKKHFGSPPAKAFDGGSHWITSSERRHEFVEHHRPSPIWADKSRR